MSVDPTPLADESEEQPPELPRFRYSLQSLFVGVAGLCLLLAAMVAAGPIGAFVLLMAVLAIAAHVLGAVLGTSLRDGTSERLALRPRELPPAPAIPRSNETSWLDRPLEHSITGSLGIGATLGAVGGGGFLAWLNWQHATVLNVAIGAFAFATLGGIGGFAVGSFWRAFSSSWESSLAASETKRPQKRERPNLGSKAEQSPTAEG